MSGTVLGGKKAAATNKRKHGKNFYKVIGSAGGTTTYQSGKLALVSFANDPERARIAGARGGRISRRGKSIKVKYVGQTVQIPVRVNIIKRLMERLGW